jgi:hypothetical protein
MQVFITTVMQLPEGYTTPIRSPSHIINIRAWSEKWSAHRTTMQQVSCHHATVGTCIWLPFCTSDNVGVLLTSTKDSFYPSYEKNTISCWRIIYFAQSRICVLHGRWFICRKTLRHVQIVDRSTK